MNGLSTRQWSGQARSQCLRTNLPAPSESALKKSQGQTNSRKQCNEWTLGRTTGADVGSCQRWRWQLQSWQCPAFWRCPTGFAMLALLLSRWLRSPRPASAVLRCAEAVGNTAHCLCPDTWCARRGMIGHHVLLMQAWPRTLAFPARLLWFVVLGQLLSFWISISETTATTSLNLEMSAGWKSALHSLNADWSSSSKFGSKSRKGWMTFSRSRSLWTACWFWIYTMRDVSSWAMDRVSSSADLSQFFLLSLIFRAWLAWTYWTNKLNPSTVTVILVCHCRGFPRGV